MLSVEVIGHFHVLNEEWAELDRLLEKPWPEDIMYIDLVKEEDLG